MLETLTAVAAVIGALAGLLNTAGLLMVNGKVDRLAGRVDAIERQQDRMLNVLLLGRAAAPPDPALRGSPSTERLRDPDRRAPLCATVAV